MNKAVQIQVSDYRLKIALLYMTATEIAVSLDTTPQSVYRWRKGITPMTDEQVRQLETAMINKLHNVWRLDWGLDKNSFGERFKLFMIGELEQAPEFLYIDNDPKKRRAQTSLLKDRLVQLLHGKTRRSVMIIETLVEEGYAGSSIQRVAQEIGVRKSVRGFGRNQKSYWSLKT